MTGRRITIGIDARSVVGQPTGVGRYVKNLVSHMADLDPSVRLRLYLPEHGRAEASIESVEPSVLSMPGRGTFPRLDNAFTWSHVRLPLHLLLRPVDLLHCPFYTLPALCPVPAVVTIHDITFDLHPEWFSRRARLAFSGFAAASARKARHVLTVSESSRRDIVQRYGVPASRVTAVHLAPDPIFAPVEDTESLERIRAKYNLPEEYLLHVGSITPRRNIDRLLEAFAAVRSRAPRLALALAGRVEPPSPPIERAIARHGLEAAVRVTGYVEAEDLPALYSASTAVVYPSLYEGFGLPVLEAMACGSPVMTSATSSLPEIAGDAALLVDPEDTAAMAEGLRAILTDVPLRERLIRRGLARAAGFTWQRAARQTLDIYWRALAARAAAAG